MPDPNPVLEALHQTSAHHAILESRLKALESLVLDLAQQLPKPVPVAALRQRLAEHQTNELESQLVRLEDANPTAAAYVQAAVDAARRRQK